MPQPSRYLSAMTAARELDVCERTVRRWIASGQLPVVRFGPHMVRIPRAAYEEFVNQREEVEGDASPPRITI